MWGVSVLFFISLDVGYHVTLVDFGALLGVDFNELATQCGGNHFKFTPRSADVAERVTLFVFLTDERFYRSHGFGVALELPEYLTFHGRYDGVGFGMLEGCGLFQTDFGTELGVFGFL